MVISYGDKHHNITGKYRNNVNISIYFMSYRNFMMLVTVPSLFKTLLLYNNHYYTKYRNFWAVTTVLFYHPKEYFCSVKFNFRPSLFQVSSCRSGHGQQNMVSKIVTQEKAALWSGLKNNCVCNITLFLNMLWLPLMKLWEPCKLLNTSFFNTWNLEL